MPRLLLLSVLAASTLLPVCGAQRTDEVDSDHDGLSDALEARLILQFRPVWMVSATDCSNVPARFVLDRAVPTVAAEDGTVYAQARRLGSAQVRRARDAGEGVAASAHVREPDDAVEVHYYHLWRRDCGELGHALDTEHVAVLLRPEVAGGNVEGARWKAVAWYAAAHEDTVCDAGQVARAGTIDAVEHGARVWISAGKHASYLAERLCRYGCGGDRCEHMRELPPGEVINLGEAAYPAVAWTHAPQWPLLAKMSRSDFAPARMARLAQLPETDIACATPEKRPAQAAMLGVNAGPGGGLNGAATGARATDTALVVAGGETGSALATAGEHTRGSLRDAGQNTGGALETSAQNTRGALGDATQRTGGALKRSARSVRRGLGRVFEAKESQTK